MRRLLQRLNGALLLFGIDVRAALRASKGLPAYRRDFRELERPLGAESSDVSFGTSRPCLGEDVVDSGLASGHYFHQDLLVARRVHDNNPSVHVDVGSRVDGFVAHVAAYRDIQVFDIRPMMSSIPNVTTVQADLMEPIPEALTDYCDSLSCLHALEHFGLGRYGDPVRWNGHLLGLENLHRILRSGGRLYLSVPIGPQRIEFNAHRVFAVEYLLGLLADKYVLERFSYVDDQGDLHEDIQFDVGDARKNFGCNYGCGIFELTKL
jgi:SAM-dependent methyltransferase